MLELCVNGKILKGPLAWELVDVSAASRIIMSTIETNDLVLVLASCAHTCFRPALSVAGKDPGACSSAEALRSDQGVPVKYSRQPAAMRMCFHLVCECPASSFGPHVSCRRIEAMRGLSTRDPLLAIVVCILTFCCRGSRMFRFASKRDLMYTACPRQAILSTVQSRANFSDRR